MLGDGLSGDRERTLRALPAPRRTASNRGWEARRARGTKIVVVDPRRTSTCDIADLHLKISPGTDVALFNGLLAELARTNTLDHAYLSQHTSGFEAAIQAAREDNPADTGLDPNDIAAFFALFAATITRG